MKQINTGPEEFPLKNGRPGYQFGTPDLVTITAGGVDAGFRNCLERCVASIRHYGHHPERKYWYNRECGEALHTANVAIENMRPRLEDLYDAAKRSNLLPGQNRSVYVLGYAQIWNANKTTEQCYGSRDVYVPPLENGGPGRKMNALVVRLNEIIKETAEWMGVTYVDIDTPFEGHRICDAESYPNQNVEFLKMFWTYVWHRKKYAPFHPTADGYGIMTRALVSAINANSGGPAIDWNSGGTA